MTFLGRLLVSVAAFLADVQVGVGTRFAAAGDPWNPRPLLACARRPRRNLDDRRDLVVAHRTLPCRARLVVCVLRTGRCAVAWVGDRGPRRAAIDLAPALARRLRHNGREVVLWLVIGGTHG